MTARLHDPSRTLPAICDAVVADAAAALRAQRVSCRLRRLVEPEVLSAEQAELQDLNRIVCQSVEEARPLCEAVGARVVLQQDPRLPAVPVLVRTLEDTLAAALDLCLDGEACLVRVRTRCTRDRAVVTIERWCAGGRSPHAAPAWEELGPMGHVELIVGDRAMRALGGRLRIEGRAKDVRVRLELPAGQQPQVARQARAEDDVAVPAPRRRRLELPGTTREPLCVGLARVAAVAPPTCHPVH